ncbi:MAG: hypothetical protein NVSMB3_02250 [Acidobacteriaceae bacterium]
MSQNRLALGPGLLCAAVAMVGATAQGQQTIGRVSLQDAMVSGALEVNDGQVTLTGGASIVARDHTAELALARGGLVAVCATSSLHITAGVTTGDRPPLLFALDRGAIELKTLVGSRDAVITPDLRITARSAGRLDLRIRVTRNGDTCVESQGASAPPMEVVEQFGDGIYQISAGQHVLFEHGSVREVVDHESSPCGCPPTPVMSLAESGVTVAPGQAARAGGEAAQRREEHPFPAAESQGLTEPGPGNARVPAVPAGQVHTQVTATMAYKAEGEIDPSSTSAPAGTASSGVKGSGRAAGSSPPAGAAAPAAKIPSQAPAPTIAAGQPSGAVPEARSTPPPSRTAVSSQAPEAPVEVKAPLAPTPPGARDIAHRLGRFFKRVFGAH